MMCSIEWWCQIISSFCRWVLQHCTGFARLVWGRLRVHRAFVYSDHTILSEYTLFIIEWYHVLNWLMSCEPYLQNSVRDVWSKISPSLGGVWRDTSVMILTQMWWCWCTCDDSMCSIDWCDVSVETTHVVCLLSTPHVWWCRHKCDDVSALTRMMCLLRHMIDTYDESIETD